MSGFFFLVVTFLCCAGVVFLTPAPVFFSAAAFAVEARRVVGIPILGVARMWLKLWEERVEIVDLRFARKL
jgi:hypothetical protein